MNWFTRCASCGSELEHPMDPRDEEMEGSSWRSHCDACNARFNEHMAAEFPHGQCQDCGAAYFPVTQKLTGKVQYVAHHAEGQCRHWEDYADGRLYEWEMEGLLCDQCGERQRRLDLTGSVAKFCSQKCWVLRVTSFLRSYDGTSSFLLSLKSVVLKNGLLTVRQIETAHGMLRSEDEKSNARLLSSVSAWTAHSSNILTNLTV